MKKASRNTNTRSVSNVVDALPRNAVNKVLRRDLREQLHEKLKAEAGG